jgi:Skp family chaperone for outer membrane proteins
MLMPEYAIWTLIVSLTCLALGLVLKCRDLSSRLKNSENEQNSLQSELDTLKEAQNKEISDIKKDHKKKTDELRNKIRKLSDIEPQ